MPSYETYHSANEGSQEFAHEGKQNGVKDATIDNKINPSRSTEELIGAVVARSTA